MDCSACGHANRDGAKFCAQCATSLPVACASCGSALSPQARFCDQCGTPVVRASEPVESAAARKVVTVLFADLVGSTSFGERFDAELARETMAEYHTMATDAVESAGGTIAKFIGDGVMALFGVPETAEDDADRAVSAGLALQRGFLPIRERVERRHRAELGLRVGINTGEIVLAEGDADLVGDAINTAARLEAACTPGEVLVGEETWRLTRSHVSYEVLGEVDVKGKHEPVATFRVADDAVRDDDQATPFVGRVEELARLQAVFDDAVDRRSARLATVIGSPGVGKTRISRQFSESLGDAVAVAVLRCERAGTTTFAPIADLLRTITTIDDESDADRVRAALRELVAELDDADRIADLLASFVGAAPDRSTEEAFLAVRRLVEAVGRAQPLVVIVDDIQWAEPLFLDLLEHLAEWVADAPALLIGLARPELRDLRPTLAEENRTVAATIALEGLDAAATAELAARLVGADSLPSDLIERLPESTEGNPLFVRELMRMLVDDGVIEQTGDGWQLTIDAEAVEVPPTIQSLLAARLDRMPADERRLVELASVVGPEFALGAVATISGATAPELQLALERLRRRELVEPTGSYWGDEPIFRFHHVLIRDAAYRRLLKRARADLHLRVGEWTERTAAELPGEHEVAIAYHYEQAHEYRHQLDDVDEATAAVGRRAADLLGTAAERSLERDDLPAAAGLAERALIRLDDGDPRVPAMLVVAAEALLGLGDVARGKPIVDRLSEVVGADERMVPWGHAFVAQLTMLTEPDRLREAEEVADRAATRLAELGDEAGVAKARLVRAGALARLGQVGRCEAELDQALTAARSAGDRRRVAAVLGAAPVAALWGPSPIPRAGGRCLDVIRLLRITTGSPAVEATSVRCQAVLEALRGRFDTARTMLSDSRATVEELGLRHALGETDLFTGIVELLAGDAAAAEGPLRSAYHGLGRLGIGADAGQAAAYLARAVLQQGRLEEAEALAAESANLAGENPQTAVAARTAQAEILAAQGRYDEAVAVANDAVARAEGTDIIVDHAAASAVLARVAALAGDAATAERAARVAAELYEQKAATVATPPSTLSSVEPQVADVLERTAIAEDERWNDADRWARQLFDDVTAGRTDDLTARFDQDCEWHEREAGAQTVHVGRYAVLAAVAQGLFPEASTVVARVETLDARGEHLVLQRTAIHVLGEADGAMLEALFVSRWNEHGRANFAASYDVDDLEAAIAELDRLYQEELGDSSPAELKPWNEADRLTRRFVELFTAGARDGWLAMLSPDQVTHDRRPLVGVDTTGADGVADAYPRDQESGALSSSVETVAVRGESLALVRWHATSAHGREWDDLHLARWTADGLNDLNVIFPPDELRAALAELDRLYLDQVDDPWLRVAVSVERHLTETAAAKDLDAFMSIYSPGFRLADRRPLGFPDHGLDELATRWGLLLGVEAAVHFYSERILAIDGAVFGHVLRSREAGGAAEAFERDDRFITVNVFDRSDGSCRLIEHFGVDQIDGARARVAELAIEEGTGGGNGVSAVGGWAHLHARAGRLDRLRDVVADDVELVLTDGETVRGIDELVVRAGEIWSGEREVLAVHIDRLALEAVSEDSEGPVTRLLVKELDDHGRLAAVRVFAGDALIEAANYFDDRWTELDESLSETDRVGIEWQKAYRNRDVAALAPLLHDDFAMVDHRPFGYPPQDADALLEAITALAPSGAVTLDVEDLLARGENGSVGRSVVLQYDHGRLVEAVATTGVTVYAGGRVLRSELFPDDEPDRAIARLKELTDAGVSHSTTSGPTNRADRFVRAEPLRVLGPEVVEVGGDVEIDTIAVFGDDDVLHRFTTPSDTRVIASEWTADGELLGVVEQSPDRDDSVEFTARGELKLPAEQRAAFAVSMGWTRAAAGGDWEAAERFLAPDFRARSRQFMGGARGMGRSTFLAFHREMWEMATRVDNVVTEMHAVSVHGQLGAEEFRMIDESGHHVTNGGLIVFMIREGRVAQVERFEDDELGEALATFEQANAEMGGGPIRYLSEPARRLRPEPDAPDDGGLQPSNAMSRRFRTFIGLLGAGDVDGAAALAHDDIVRIDRRSGVSAPPLEGRQAYLDAVAGVVDLGFEILPPRTVAVRGDRHALVELVIRTTDEGAELRHLMLAEGADDMTGRYIALFDLDDHDVALRELDERWLTTASPDDAETYRVARRLYRSYVALDVDAVTEGCALDFVFVDRRPLGFGELDRHGFLELFRTRAETRGPGQGWVTAVHRLGGGVVLVSNQEATGADASDVANGGLILSVVREGRVERSELFAEEQMDEAMARADELVPRFGSGLSNAASRAMRGASPASVVETLAAFDESHCLCRVEGDDGAEFVIAVADADGRVVETASYPESAFDDARRDMLTRWAGGLDPRRRLVSRLATALGEAWVAPSEHAFDEVLAPDFQLVDGRTLGMGTLDRYAFEEALRGREADGATGVPVPSRVQFVSDDVMVFRANNLGHAPESGVDWEEIACNVLVVEGDRIARLEMFDEDHWDGALARAEELAAEASSAQLENAATRLRDRWNASLAGDLTLDWWADDFVREDRRAVTSAGTAGRDEVYESISAYRDMGGTVTVQPAIAIRGERLGLFPTTVEAEGSVIDFLGILELDEDGRICRNVQFDPGDLAAAQDELDRLYLKTLTNAQAATLRPGLQFRSAMSARGTAVMSVVLADDFVANDHREMSFPELDRDAFLEINRQRDELFGEALVLTTDIHRIEGDVIVASNRMAGLTPDSGVEWLHEFVNIFVVRDGQLHGLENFGPGNLDAAMARADELAKPTRSEP